MTRRYSAALLGVLVMACASAARGDPRAPAPALSRAPSGTGTSGVYWHDEWPRFTVLEAMLGLAITARNNDLGAHLDGPRSATLEFQVPVLDPGGRDLFRAETEQGRRGAARLSDVGFRTLVLAPYVVDVGVAALAIHRNPDVAAQLALIDFEVLTLAGMTQLLGSRVLGRARPYVEQCPPEGCSGGPYRSFLSGHAMASFTAAGLMCVHHEMLPLFGGGAPDRWACIWAVSVASGTSALRLVADEHWASDVVLGAGLGWVYGYYLPKLLHFHTAKATKSAAAGRTRAFTWLPTFMGTTQSASAGVLGTF